MNTYNRPIQTKKVNKADEKLAGIVQGRNMVYGLRAQSPKYDWDQGSEERAQGSEEWYQGSQVFLSPNQGSDLLRSLKISYHNIFPRNKVCVQ